MSDSLRSLLIIRAELRSLSCYFGQNSTFDPAGESKPLTSLINLTFVGGSIVALLRDGFLTPANLSSLCLLCVDNVEVDDGLDDFSLTDPSTLYAMNLHHLHLTCSDDELLPLLMATRQLRSLECHSSDLLSFPVDLRFGTALVAIRMQLNDVLESVMTSLENALESGLIDRQTVIFCTGRWGVGHRSVELGEWCRARSMRVEWWDGQLETGWRDGQSFVDNGHRDFASWVDKRAERIAAIQE